MGAPLPSALAELFATAPIEAAAKARVRALMSGADRHYHGLDHIALLWKRHRQFAPQARFAGARDSRLVACAILFHDCVYAADRSDNEARSAEVWLEAAQASGVSAEERAWVAETIGATRDHLGAAPNCEGAAASGDGMALRLWVLDLDLTPLGEAPAVFDRNARHLRAEAAQMSDAAFAAKQRSMLRRYAEAPVIYRTPALAARFDAPARRNLARHLEEGSRAGDQAK